MHPKMLAQSISTYPLRSEKRSQDLLDHRPGYLWDQFHRNKCLVMPPEAQDSFTGYPEIAHPVPLAVGSHQKATAIAFVQIDGNGPRLSRFAPAHSE